MAAQNDTEPPVSRSVVHGMFTLERFYAAAPSQVFHAMTDPAAKSKWFGAGDAFTILTRQMDVRPGGREKHRRSPGDASRVPRSLINRQRIKVFGSFFKKRTASLSSCSH